VVLERLREQNPWWSDPSAINRDPALQELAEFPFQRPLSLLEELKIDRPIVYTLRGPRQVGKTTALKMLIQRLIGSGVPSTNVLYYSLDLEREPEAIVELVNRGRAIGAEGRRYILLDEISSVPDWQRAVKYLRDNTSARNDFFVLTGSIASDIRRGAERLPGRRGPAADLDKILLPLSFSEFVAAVDRSLPKPEVRLRPDSLISNPKEASEILERHLVFLPALDRHLEAYVRVGGFPAAVRDYLAEGTREVTDATVRALWDIIAGDISRIGRDPAVAMKLLERLSISLGTPISWTQLAEAIGVASPATAEEYARALAEAFELLVVYCWDTSRATRAPKKGKKLYAVDPIILRFPERITYSTRLPDLSLLVENIAALALFRSAERELVEAFPVPQALFHWRSAAGKEIDFLIGRAPAKLPVEVKYQHSITGRDTLVIRQSFGRGILLSRNTLDFSGPVKIAPTALFLWLHEE
jgi:hypothetical protein